MLNLIKIFKKNKDNVNDLIKNVEIDEKSIYRLDLNNIEIKILQDIINNIDTNNNLILKNLQDKINNPKLIKKSNKKLEAIKEARKAKEKQISEKIENAMNLLRLYNKKITIYNIAKEASIAYQTAKKFIEKNENLKKIIEN
jgi:DNA-binding protein H-NS